MVADCSYGAWRTGCISVDRSMYIQEEKNENTRRRRVLQRFIMTILVSIYGYLFMFGY